MKLIITLIVLFMLSTGSPAGLFSDKEQDERIQQQEQQLAQERQSTGAWQVIAVITAIGAIILFTVGTALGSTTRRHGKTK